MTASAPGWTRTAPGRWQHPSKGRLTRNAAGEWWLVLPGMRVEGPYPSLDAAQLAVDESWDAVDLVRDGAG